MDRALYKVITGDKVEYVEAIPAFDEFEFMCCEQTISIDFEEKEVGLSKSEKCSVCGKLFEVTIEEYINKEDVDYHVYEYLKKELEKDDWIKIYWEGGAVNENSFYGQ